VPWARLYHSNRKQSFTFELEEGRVVIAGLIKGESTSIKVLPWDPFATFNVDVLIHSFVHIGCAFGTTILFLYSYEDDFTQGLLKKNEKKLAQSINFTFRYIDDVLSLNNYRFGDIVQRFYQSGFFFFTK
jgi:hypothetical protein